MLLEWLVKRLLLQLSLFVSYAIPAFAAWGGIRRNASMDADLFIAGIMLSVVCFVAIFALIRLIHACMGVLVTKYAILLLTPIAWLMGILIAKYDAMFLSSRMHLPLFIASVMPPPLGGIFLTMGERFNSDPFAIILFFIILLLATFLYFLILFVILKMALAKSIIRIIMVFAFIFWLVGLIFYKSWFMLLYLVPCIALSKAAQRFYLYRNSKLKAKYQL